MNKTAMQELIQELNILERDGLIQIYKSPVGNDMLENILQFLLKKEKEQICNAYVEGLEGSWISAEEYYSREFNQNK